MLRVYFWGMINLCKDPNPYFNSSLMKTGWAVIVKNKLFFYIKVDLKNQFACISIDHKFAYGTTLVKRHILKTTLFGSGDPEMIYETPNRIFVQYSNYTFSVLGPD